MIRLCYSRQKLRGGYVGKAKPLIETKQRANPGGAGGIRTHEWRFCRPLPWATWVPRRIFKYSKSERTLRTSQTRPHSTRPIFSPQQPEFLLRAKIAPILREALG